MTESLSDTHCHLNFDSFDNDRGEVISRSRLVGVSHILNPGIDLGSCKQALQLSEKLPEVYVAIGLHPNSADEWEMGFSDEFLSLASFPKVVAIGEIGLDYYWDKTSRKVQIRVFEAQLEAARKLGLPVVIHNREATDDTLAILKTWQASIQEKSLALNPGVLHSYSYGIEAAEVALNSNFYVGITGPVTFKNAEELRKVVAFLP